MEKIKLAAVSYLNTKPLLYGLLRHPIGERLDIELAIPSVCAQKLSTGAVDLALVPVAVIPELSTYELVSDFCIGTVGPVKTVCIYGEVPIEEMDGIYLDFHSRTSAMLTRLLLEEHWQLKPALLPATAGYIDEIKGKRGGLVIGDRTIGLDNRFPYVYDLGEVWQQHTGLPFAFAAWVSRKPLPTDFLRDFNTALAAGIDHISELQFLLPNPDPAFDLVDYFTHYISYELDAGKRKALERFLTYCEKQIALAIS